MLELIDEGKVTYIRLRDITLVEVVDDAVWILYVGGTTTKHHLKHKQTILDAVYTAAAKVKSCT